MERDPRQPSWTPSFRLGLLANLIGSDRRDPVPVAQARHPVHLALATRQGRDDIALGMFATERSGGPRVVLVYSRLSPVTRTEGEVISRPPANSSCGLILDSG